MSISNIKCFKFVILILFGICFLKFGALVTNAQIPSPTPIPAPAPIPCSDPGKDPEFHSLRPYQASPCVAETAPTAKFCGNTLTLQDKIDITYQPGIDNCSQPSGGKVICNYVIPRSEKITINLSNAKLPIMGNTENVPNSQSKTGESPTLSDADKVNGYVSWYLNGVMNRAEDGSSKNSNSETADSKTADYNIVNLSGPLNKLLPSAILDAQRIKSINNTKVTNHNQIVVCASSNWGAIGDVVGIGSFKPNPCYTDLLEKRLRLSDWQSGGLSLINTIANAIGNITPEIFQGLIGDQWNHRFPPLPWDDGTGQPFANADLYQKAYQEWRGNSCITLPIINKTLCIDNPLVTNKWADLYPYIPLSSTEDIKGNIEIDSVSVGGPGITNVTFTSQSSTLYFPHLVESDQLGSTLQDTYISKDQQKDQKTGPATAVAPPSSCTTVDVRSNAGDKLFATSLTGNLGYTASFSCTFDVPTPTQPYCSGTCLPNQRECIYAGGRVGEGSCNNRKFCCNLPNQVPKPTPTPQPPQTCSKTVSIALSTSSNTPKIDDIWSRLVAGPTAVVKRMFPKLGTQIGTLKDIPGSTSIDYSGSTQGSGELNLPHVGGISEYFLKGIQTMLRPKGYGEPISFGEVKSQSSCKKGGKLPDLPTATENACKICNKPSNLPQVMVDVLEAAAQAYNVPASVIYGTFMHEGGDHYTWNDANAAEWSLCGGEVPNCDKNGTTAQAPYGWFPVYFYDFGYWDAVKAVDPERTMEETSPCNFLDATFATAKALSEWSSGLAVGVKFTVEQDPSQTYSKFPDICLGYDVNNGVSRPSSCASWNKNTVVTSQIGYGGWCPEPGKHPIQPYFPDITNWITSTVTSYQNYTCK